MTDKKTTKKAMAKSVLFVDPEPTTVKPVPAAKKVISFFFPKGEGSIFVWPKTNSEGERISNVSIRVESNMIRLRPDDSDYAFIAKRLRADKRNSKNGGNMFEEVETGKVATSNIAERIDQLNAMDKPALITLLGGGMQLHRLTTGALIAKALELE